MLCHDSRHILSIRMATWAIVEEQPATMADAEFRDIFVQLDDDTGVLTGVLQVFLSTAQSNQRWLDRFDLQPHRIGDLHELIERPVVRHSQERMLVSSVKLLCVA